MSIEEAALAAGATVLGDPDTKQHYLLTAEQLAHLVRLISTHGPETGMTEIIPAIIIPPPY